MGRNSSDPYNPDNIAELYNLITGADTNDDVCRTLLFELGFRQSEKVNLLQKLLAWIETPLGAVLTSLLVFVVSLTYLTISNSIPAGVKVVVNNSPFTTAANLGTFTVVLIGFSIGYRRWALAEKNRNVDDTIRRKELANKMMVDNASILLPYVGDVFEIETEYAETLVTDRERIKVQMYVFTEIDNLEFVFDKVNAGLLEDKQALRAIKIFMARCENKNFERMTRTLVEKGRYNFDFVKCVTSLSDVADWARGRTFPTLGGLSDMTEGQRNDERDLICSSHDLI